MFSAYCVPKISNYTVYQDSKSFRYELYLNRVFIHLIGFIELRAGHSGYAWNKKSLASYSPKIELHREVITINVSFLRNAVLEELKNMGRNDTCKPESI